MAQNRLPDQAEGETQKAYTAFLDYCRMGAGRSLRALVQLYREPDAENPPTKHDATVFGWSSRYQWQDRVAEYDKAIAKDREGRLAEKRQEIEDAELEDYGRELMEWRRRFDVLMAAPNGMNTFEVTALFKLRKEIADLGRRAVGLPEKISDSRVQAEHTGADGGPIKHEHAFTDMSDAELERLLG